MSSSVKFSRRQVANTEIPDRPQTQLDQPGFCFTRHDCHAHTGQTEHLIHQSLGIPRLIVEPVQISAFDGNHREAIFTEHMQPFTHGESLQLNPV